MAKFKLMKALLLPERRSEDLSVSLDDFSDLESALTCIQGLQNQSPSGFYWLSVEDPSEQDLLMIERFYQLQPMIREDYLRNTPTPQFISYPDYSYVLVHRIFYHFKNQSCEPRGVSLIYHQNYMITLFRSHLRRSIDSVRDRVMKEQHILKSLGTHYVLFQMLVGIIEDYRPIVSSWEEELEILEELIFKGSLEPVTDKILKFKKLVLIMKRYLFPQKLIYQEVYEHISFEQSEKSSSAFLKHILDESNAIIEDFDSLGQLANSVFDIYAANLTIELNKSSHDLNRVMQRLSIMTAIFLPLSFIVGVYGMNIEGMPELKWHGFYFFLWGAMIGIVSILLVLFKKLKWY